MIRALTLAVAMLAAALPSAAQGVSSGTVQITVTPAVTRAFTVQLDGGGDSKFDFQSVSMSSGVFMATAPFVVANTGDISLTYVLQIATETDSGSPSRPWSSLDSSSGNLAVLTDRYRLKAKFDTVSSGIPNQTEYIVKKATATIAQAAFPGGAYASAGETGAGVTANPAAQGNERHLWFEIATPGYTSTVSQKRIGITLSAQ